MAAIPDPKTRILQLGQTQTQIFLTMQQELSALLTSISTNPALDETAKGLLTQQVTSVQKATAQAGVELDGITSFANAIPDPGLQTQETTLAQSALAEQGVETSAITNSLSLLGYLANKLDAAQASIPPDRLLEMTGQLTDAQDAAGAALAAGSQVKGNLEQLVQAFGGTVTNGS